MLNFLSALGLIMLLTAFILLPKRTIILPLILITVSVAIILFSGSPPAIFWLGLREMRAIIPLIIIISLVSWILTHRPYIKALLKVGKNQVSTPVRFFAVTAGLSHIISSFMAVGGIPFVYQIFQGEKKPAISQNAWDFTLSTAIMRGFTLTVLWTAVHPAFAYVIAGTSAPLLTTMLKGMGLAFIGFIIGILIYLLQKKQMKLPADITPNLGSAGSDENTEGLATRFLFWVSLLMGGIILTTQWLNMDILLAVPVVIILVTTVYFLSHRAMRQYKTRWQQLITEGLETRKREMFLILSAGILVGTLKETGFGEVLFNYFLTAAELLNINILIGLTFVVILLGLAGFPPIPAMVLLSGILVNIPGELPAELIALSLLLGVAVTLVIAPVTVPLLLISGLNGRSMAQNGFRWNKTFGISLLLAGLLYIQFLYWIG
ncbi:hypothetical protein [Evansella clarkii]|uniref:hypothetical protein n=1 Tax=Evansella clarkii TaxID=79879 RepID=UPI001117ACE1|nr:hypothetical protein [Evansella clarkii]